MVVGVVIRNVERYRESSIAFKPSALVVTL